MKNIVSASAIIAALSAGSALAADLPSRKEAVVAAPMWTGFYAGLNIGGNAGTNAQTTNNLSQIGSANYTPDEITLATPHPTTFGGLTNYSTSAATQSGVIGGVQLGYNYQFNQKIILGFETDFQGTSISGTSNQYGIASAKSNLFDEDYEEYSVQKGVTHQNISAGVSWLGTVRGRAGYLVSPTLLTYFTGGLTYGGVWATSSLSSVQTIKVTGEDDVVPTSVHGLMGSRTNSNILVGWNAGGGFEWMFMQNWSLKTEAMYWNLGNMNVATYALGSAPPISWDSGTESLNGTVGLISGRSNVNYQGVIARVGVNYHFNFASAPVAAKF